MHARGGSSAVKSSRSKQTPSPDADSPSRQTRSPDKKRQRLRSLHAEYNDKNSMIDTVSIPELQMFRTTGGDDKESTLEASSLDMLTNGNSQISVVEDTSQSTFIEKMRGINMSTAQSQNSFPVAPDASFLHTCGEGTVDSWEDSISAGFKPRLHFFNSQESGYSSETVRTEVSRDGFNVFGGGDGSMLAPSDGSMLAPSAGNHSNYAAPPPRAQNNLPLHCITTSVFNDPFESKSASAKKALVSSRNPFIDPIHRKRPPMTGMSVSPEETNLFETKFEREFTVGTGAFSEVCVARNRVEGTIYAVKRVRAVITGERVHQRLLHEVYALSVLRGCPSTIQYFDSWVDDGHLWICTELCLKETLRSFLTYGKLLAMGTKFFELRSDCIDSATPRFSAVSYDEYEAHSQTRSDSMDGIGKPYSLHRNLSTASNGGPAMETPLPGGFEISEQLAWVILESMGKALDFMHSNNIAHLDIKPGNIFIAVSSYFELESLYGRLRDVTEYTLEHYQHLSELEPKLISGQWKIKLGVD